ncbi:unnamed protein product, partial [marine sediment metagenome]
MNKRIDSFTHILINAWFLVLMKDLLIQTAKRTGLVDAEKLVKFLEDNKEVGRLDELLLGCSYFTEEAILKLFAAALGWEFLPEIPPKA